LVASPRRALRREVVPIGRIGASVGFHFRYGQSDEVKKAALPFYFQAVWLLKSSPALSFREVFPFGVVSVVLLPLAAIGAPLAARRRPVWAYVALVGSIFLLKARPHLSLEAIGEI
jgi:hypothetical protein